MNNLINKLNSLCFYRYILDDKTFKEFYTLLTAMNEPVPKFSEAQSSFFKLRADLADFSFSIYDPKAPSLWQNYVIHLLTGNNSIIQALEKDKNFLFADTFKNDLAVLAEVYNYNFKNVINYLEPGSANIFNKKVYSETSDLATGLKSKSKNKIYQALQDYISENGTGIFRSEKVFSIDAENKDLLEPVHVKKVKPFNEIVGYNDQKDKLIRNTRSFVDQNVGLNTLLYGDMGTGKSTMVKALIEEFKDTPLRFVEVKKNQINLIPKLSKKIKETNYPFILFIDDLSFEEGEDTYKDLKIALEGSFEELPENLLIYATSNKRTLVSQSKSERDDAINAREIIEEKNSLVSRFGLMIPFAVPKQESYLKIVEFLANQNDIPYTEELKQKAIQWELRHMNRSGRTAEQFIQSVKSEIGNSVDH